MKNDQWFPRSEQSDDFMSALQQRTEELYQIPDGEPDENGMIDLPVLVLRDVVVFPRMVSPDLCTTGINLDAIQDAQFNYETMAALVLKGSGYRRSQAGRFPARGCGGCCWTLVGDAGWQSICPDSGTAPAGNH